MHSQKISKEMEKPCYCCHNKVTDPGTKENITDLDVALKELDMLSVAPETQRRRHQDYSAKGSSSTVMSEYGNNSGKSIQRGFCVLHMNRRFVTNFLTSPVSLSPNKNKNKRETYTVKHSSENCSLLSPSTKDEQFKYKEVLTSNQTLKHSLKIRPNRNRLRFQKPYELPWLYKLEERSRTFSWNQDNDSSSEDANSCNRSNPSSPSKSSLSSGGIMRSRSLDNLASKTWDKKDEARIELNASENKEDIENVSQQMKDLKVN